MDAMDKYLLYRHPQTLGRCLSTFDALGVSLI